MLYKVFGITPVLSRGSWCMMHDSEGINTYIYKMCHLLFHYVICCSYEIFDDMKKWWLSGNNQTCPVLAFVEWKFRVLAGNGGSNEENCTEMELSLHSNKYFKKYIATFCNVFLLLVLERSPRKLYWNRIKYVCKNQSVQHSHLW